MNKKIPRILKNKYVICTVLFFVVAFFVEDNNITTSLALKEKKEVMSIKQGAVGGMRWQ